MLISWALMIKRIWFVLFFATLTLGLGGCNRLPWGGTPPPDDYFKTDFQDESQFIVETIVTDLAEQIYYAKFHRLPNKNEFHVSATETLDSSFGAPVYDIQVVLNSALPDIRTGLKVNGPIWSPEVYDQLTAQLAQAVGLPAGQPGSPGNTELLSKLTDGTAETIELENQRLSAALQDDFANGALHEKAALLLGAFTLREHSGDFYEIRSPLCRVTTHLAMARFLEAKNLSAINGGMAGAILDTLMNNQADALQTLKQIPATDPAVASWIRALQARNTCDYRQLDNLNSLSQIECINWFYALDQSANTGIAWSKLSDTQRNIPDFVRIANENSYPVGVGHQLLDLSLRLDLNEIDSVYQLSQKKKLDLQWLVPVLNRMPDRCFTQADDGKTDVHVIGWGLWAGFFQRQICHSVEHESDFLQRIWGVPDAAKKFSDKCDRIFGELRLYPFVRRFNAIDAATYRQSVDDGFKVTVATPQLVPAQCWDYLDYWLTPDEYYHPNPNPHINEWHKHNPPPGTAYNPQPRFDHPSLVHRRDSGALFDKLHEIAPYDSNISWYIWKTKYKEKPTYEEALDLFGPTVLYSPYSMRKVAGTVLNQPDQYEQLLARSAAIDPSDYFTLADYFATRAQDDKAARYYEQGNKLNPDPVDVAAHADWLIHYDLKHGRTEDARSLADLVGAVYSGAGLQAKAEFLEATGDYPGAYQWFSKIDERYRDSTLVTAFVIRHKAETGDTQFDALAKAQLAKTFPQGIERVALADFKSAPADGVLIKKASDRAIAAGIRNGDVIVSINGIRSHTYAQYLCGRQVKLEPEMDLIVWQGDRYTEIKTSPPNHRFGGDMGDYASR
jgi:tetratricopeptide (TPR) repeat protein